jgi:hypothetical protein|tara:strand:- start:103 stop:336 length:234 start_codon:yes stop_codon:yes gene_type:complete
LLYSRQGKIYYLWPDSTSLKRKKNKKKFFMKNATLGTVLASGNSNPYSNYDKKKELGQLKKQTFFKKNKNNFFKILS